MEETQEVKLTRHQRYYALHRADKLSKENEKYNTNPEVIAKREERERKKAEKAAEKEAKKEAEKEAKRQEKEEKWKKTSISGVGQTSKYIKRVVLNLYSSYWISAIRKIS
jgi:hypothetical protein